MGSLSGDTGTPYSQQYTGYGEQTFHLHVTEDSTSCVYDSAAVALTSPPGIQYDLYVGFACGQTAASITNGGAGGQDIINTCDCSTCYPPPSGPYDVWIQVVYNSGTGCGTWTLQAEGNVYVSACDSTCPF